MYGQGSPRKAQSLIIMAASSKVNETGMIAA
jgi:hypothetical protein